MAKTVQPVANLKALKRAIDAAVDKTQTPPYPGAESWPMTSPQEHLSRAEWRLAIEVVRVIRAEHRSTFKRFPSERAILFLLIEYLVRLKRAPTTREVVAHLNRQADSEANWLVQVPLYNLAAPKMRMPLTKRAMLVESHLDIGYDRRGPDDEDPFAIRRHFGDEIDAGSRWQRVRDGGEVDRRQFASLLLIEEGTEGLAVAVAESTAKYAVAMWCLLAPPRGSKKRLAPLWPSSGRWSPSAFIYNEPRRKVYENKGLFGGSSAPVRGRSVTTFDVPYVAPTDQAKLTAPFEAIAQAQAGKHCARALLTASRFLYLASRVPNDLEPTERVLYIWSAREALSEFEGHDPDFRWDALVANLRLRGELTRRHFGPEEVEEALETLRSVRNVAAHKSHAAVVNLNIPEGMEVKLRYGKSVDADDVALALMSSNIPALLILVRAAALKLCNEAIASGWDDKKYHSRFTPSKSLQQAQRKKKAKKAKK